MSFAAPLVLLALLLLPVGAWLYVRHDRERQRGRARFADAALMPAVAPNRPGGRRHVAPAIYAVALALLVVAVARPQRSTAVPIDQATAVLVIDRSASMRSGDVAPNRLAAVQRAANRFLDKVRPSYEVGAVAFNNKVQSIATPGLDRDAVRRGIDRLTARGGTNAGDAIKRALQLVRVSRDGDRTIPATIVLLSDGESTKGLDPIEAAQTAKDQGVRINTIALGTDTGTFSSRRRNGTIQTQRVPPDREELRQIAQASGGRYADAEDADTLNSVYERLGSRVGTKDGKKELDPVVMGGALVLILAGAGVALGLNGRVI